MVSSASLWWATSAQTSPVFRGFPAVSGSAASAAVCRVSGRERRSQRKKRPPNAPITNGMRQPQSPMTSGPTASLVRKQTSDAATMPTWT